MKKGFLIAFLFLINSTHARELFQYNLENNEKLESTYTAEFTNGKTIHFAVIKNTASKNYFLTPFLVDKNNHVQKMDRYVSKKLLEIKSYHSNKNNATITAYDSDGKELHVIDYDFNTGKIRSKTQALLSAPDNIFRLIDRTVLVAFDKKENRLKVNSILDSDYNKLTEIAVPKDKIKLFNKLIEETPESINQEEFVENGSISKRKGYILNSNLIYTLEKDKNETQVFNFDLSKTNDFTYATLNSSFAKETKDISNYFVEDKIIFLGVNKQSIQIKIISALDLKEIKKINFNLDSNAQIKSELLEDYIKTALKSSMKSTIAINKTKNNGFAFILDNVISATYSYNYNWFFHHQFMLQQQMMQQQMMMQNARSFGPSAYEPFDFSLVTKDKKNIPIQFVLDANLNFIDGSNSETIYPKIDRDTYLEKFKDDKSIKKFSTAFTNNEIRYIYQNSKSKAIIINVEKL